MRTLSLSFALLLSATVLCPFLILSAYAASVLVPAMIAP
jgi:hypothetical protein